MGVHISSCLYIECGCASLIAYCMTVLSISVFFCALCSKYMGYLIYLPHFFKYYVCINIPDIWKLLISSYKFTSGKYATVKFSSYKAEHLYIVNSCTFLRLHDGEQQVTISSFICTLPFSKTPLAPFPPTGAAEV